MSLIAFDMVMAVVIAMIFVFCAWAYFRLKFAMQKRMILDVWKKIRDDIRRMP